jgi:hypothetical protein
LGTLARQSRIPKMGISHVVIYDFAFPRGELSLLWPNLSAMKTVSESLPPEKWSGDGVQRIPVK